MKEEKNIYVGNRYVPKIMGEWNKQEPYEGLSIVTNEGTSYTSKKGVPIGVDILNENYWVVTGNYNAQIENYRQEVKKNSKDLNDYKGEVTARFQQTTEQLDQTEIKNTNNKKNIDGRSINVKYPPDSLAALKGDGTLENLADAQALINYAKTSGGEVYFPRGTFKFEGTLLVPAGVTISGHGTEPISGRPTMLDFSLNTTQPSFLIEKSSDITLQKFYLKGRTVGTGHEIYIKGGCSRVNFSKLTINSQTSGSGIHVDESGHVFGASWENIFIRGCGTGITTSALCTSITISNCFVDGSSQVGYYISGTYCGLISCGVDNSKNYGYIIAGASQISLLTCGAETNYRSAIVIDNSTGIEISAFRGHVNNQSKNTFYPSLLDIRDSDNITISNSRDTNPTPETVYSVTSTTVNVGNNVFIVNSNFDKPLSNTIRNKPRIENNGFYIGGRLHTYGVTKPTTGSWSAGDIMYNTNPTTLGTVLWICVVAGSPGTWESIKSTI